MLLLIIQTIVLLVIILSLSIVDLYFAYIVSLVLGVITLVYFNKMDKKQVLKINLFSSIVVAIIAGLIYFFYLRSLGGLVALDNLPSYIALIDVNSFLLKVFGSLVIFNIPSLVYFFFKK